MLNKKGRDKRIHKALRRAGRLERAFQMGERSGREENKAPSSKGFAEKSGQLAKI